MKATSARVSAGIIALLVVGAAWAEETGQAAASPMKGPAAVLDADRDGKVSPAEHAAGARAMFVRLDKDTDDKLTPAELSAAAGTSPGPDVVAAEPAKPRLPAQIKPMDTDGDDALSAAEQAAGMRKEFLRMDTNKDGFLTDEEILAGMLPPAAKVGQ